MLIYSDKYSWLQNVLLGEEKLRSRVVNDSY